MALTKTTTIDQITIQDDGLILLRDVLRAFDDDGTLIGQRNHRSVLEPGDDVSTQPQKIQRVTQIFWTQAVIDAYRAKKAAAIP